MNSSRHHMASLAPLGKAPAPESSSMLMSGMSTARFFNEVGNGGISLDNFLGAGVESGAPSRRSCCSGAASLGAAAAAGLDAAAAGLGAGAAGVGAATAGVGAAVAGVGATVAGGLAAAGGLGAAAADVGAAAAGLAAAGALGFAAAAGGLGLVSVSSVLSVFGFDALSVLRGHK